MSLGGINGGLVGDVESGGSDKPSENEDGSNRAKEEGVRRVRATPKGADQLQHGAGYLGAVV